MSNRSINLLIFHGIVIEHDEDGHMAGIDFDNKKNQTELNETVLNRIPAQQ